jgi:hypothetical protein
MAKIVAPTDISNFPPEYHWLSQREVYELGFKHAIEQIRKGYTICEKEPDEISSRTFAVPLYREAKLP